MNDPTGEVMERLYRRGAEDVWKQTKTNQMRTSRDFVFRAFFSEGGNHRYLFLAETQR